MRNLVPMPHLLFLHWVFDYAVDCSTCLFPIMTCMSPCGLATSVIPTQCGVMPVVAFLRSIFLAFVGDHMNLETCSL